MQFPTASRQGSKRDKRVNNFRLLFRVHAVQRMFERKISARAVAHTLHAGEMIEDYSSEMPEPSRLVLGFQGSRPLHVVTSENQKTNEITVVTAYNPDPGKWDKDFKRRRS
jgi:hypothetical protein